MAGQIELRDGDGVWVTSTAGEKYFDATSGTFNIPLGHRFPSVVEAVTAQLNRTAHLGSSHSKTYANDVLTALLDEAPAPLAAGWMRDIIGSTANECALHIAQKKSHATGIVSLFLSHHGQTALTTAISGDSFRRTSNPQAATSNSIKVPAPYCHRCFYNAKYPSCNLLCVERIHDFIEFSGNGSVACLIVEPILGNGGNIVPPPKYFEAIRKLCDEHAMLLIADEVQTGIGRTGHFFASTALGLKPDLMTLAKGLGGIGIPIAAVLMRDDLQIIDKHEHSFTSGGSVIGLAAATETIRVMRCTDLLALVRERGKILEELLRKIATGCRAISDVRGMGYMWGIEFSNADGSPAVEMTKAVVETAQRDHHLLIRSSRYGQGNVVKVRPPLVATVSDLEELCRRLSSAIDDVVPTSFCRMRSSGLTNEEFA
jgi:4-aminobutyrate aminotransferase